MDAAVLAAAVADYRPAQTAKEKIKKGTEEMTLRLEKTPDIAASLGRVKRPDQLLVGFALETEDELANAREKLERKNFDLIVLNSLRDAGAGFHHDTNKVTILYRNNKADHFQLKSKKAVAEDIVVAMARHWGLDEQPQAAG
ncbi:MAG: phosphopantothenoylcysteine decarboxylase, partial [Saprospiraceae bacterium]|nr:phosphopantothenoylcysteine decarboxylase [Saprospiraceae bacterium]